MQVSVPRAQMYKYETDIVCLAGLICIIRIKYKSKADLYTM
jgi:hypothetical protein